MQASPHRIQRALERAVSLPDGGWYVAAATRDVGQQPMRVQIAGEPVVLWRCKDGLRAAPDVCPHLGARLSDGPVRDGRLVCPWHGLELGDEGHGAWKPYPTHDDGVLIWVRLIDSPEASSEPHLPPRPATYIDAVLTMEAHCEPMDVIANRLDPWHGAHFHPYSFAALEVMSADDEVLRMRVSKRVAGPLCMEVDVTFHCPDPRTIVMTIVEGEGVGSVVETHATPIEPGRTAIIEATLATSERPGFRRALSMASVIRPFILASARKLWIDDAAYAERLFELRSKGRPVFRIPVAPSAPSNLVRIGERSERDAG